MNRKWDTTPAADTVWAIYGDTDIMSWMGGAKSAMFQHDVEEDFFIQCSGYDERSVV